MVEIESLAKCHIEIASGSSQPLIRSSAAGEDDCRSCIDCGKYFHFKCAKILQYRRNTLSSKCKCDNVQNRDIITDS